MNNPHIDNTADSDLSRVITWQYDNAENLVATIGMLKDFFRKSTSDLWDSIAAGVNISVPDEASDFDLAKWGKLLGVERPVLTINGSSVTMKSEAYRRILVARFRLLNSDATTEDYITFIKYIFGEAVEISYNDNMALTFSYVGNVPQSTNSVEYHLYAAFNQFPDAIFIYPAGVRSNVQSSGPIVAFEEQAEYGTYTSVAVRIFGTEGTTIPVGSKFSDKDDNVYTSIDSGVIGEDGRVDIRFKCEGDLYIPACTEVSITDSGGSAISGVSAAFCPKRSTTDFSIDTMDNATLAWKR